MHIHSTQQTTIQPAFDSMLRLTINGCAHCFALAIDSMVDSPRLLSPTTTTTTAPATHASTSTTSTSTNISTSTSTTFATTVY